MTAHGLSRVHTCAAPATIWATKSPAAPWTGTPGRSIGGPSCGRAPSMYRTSTNTSAARTRCANITVAAPPSAGTSRPFISGQSVKASPAPFARTKVPTTSRVPVATAVNSASRAKPVSAGAAAPSRPRRWAITATYGHVRHEDQRDAEVGGDPVRAEVRLHDDAAQDRLRQHQGDGRRRRPQQPFDAAQVLPGEERRDEHHHRGDEHQDAMRELDQRVHRAGGEQLAGEARRARWSTPHPSRSRGPGRRPRRARSSRRRCRWRACGSG